MVSALKNPGSHKSVLSALPSHSGGDAVLPDLSSCNIPKRENYTKRPQTMPNGHEIYQMATKIYQHFPFQKPPKITQNWDFALKLYHLATLAGETGDQIEALKK
jgi:hypothetical protein